MKKNLKRSAINRRFVQLFRWLEKRGIISKSDREGMNYSRVAEYLDTKVHILAKYLVGERYIPIEKALLFCELFQLDKRRLLEDQIDAANIVALPDADTSRKNVMVSNDIDRVRTSLENRKIALNLKNEVKWGRVTYNYLDKYQSLMDTFFEFVQQNKVKVRIMFRQNALEPQNLSEYNKKHSYFLLYYQFIKHAFGLKYSNPSPQPIYIRTFFDELPDNKEKAELFKNHIYALESLSTFAKTNIRIRRRDIGEVDSKNHVLLQCLDIVLGAMAFRLNDLHKAKAPGTSRRGKRTVAKEKLYKHILKKIRKIYPNFNIGVSTGTNGTPSNIWNHPYRHWKFIPRDFKVNEDKFKKISPT